MVHVESLQVVHYRGISGLELPTLAHRANLITGLNGVGKTALAEALWLFHGRYNLPLLWNKHVHRGISVSPSDALPALAPDGETAIELHGVERRQSASVRIDLERFTDAHSTGDANGGSRAKAEYQGLPFPVVARLRVSLDGEPVDPDTSHTFATAPEGAIAYPLVPPPEMRAGGIILTSPNVDDEGLIERYSEIVLEDNKKSLRSMLRAIRPDVDDLEILMSDGQSYIWGTTKGGQRRRLQDLGNGMVRLFRYLTSAFAARGGILIVDEIENGFHYSALEKLWRHLKILCDQADVQLFATTHSRECIHAAVSAFGEQLDNLAVHGLFRRDDSETEPVSATCFTADTLEGALSLDLEMR
ncbi:MAG: AAA family ATPase [Holophagales bacterium]|nr:AAA family ATPase [Holophagales bacterium]